MFVCAQENYLFIKLVEEIVVQLHIVQHLHLTMVEQLSVK